MNEHHDRPTESLDGNHDSNEAAGPLHPYDLSQAAPNAPNVVLVGSKLETETLSFKARSNDDPTKILARFKANFTRRKYPHGYQNYVCPQCLTGESHGILDAGVTPFMSRCHNPDCGGTAQSTGRTDEPEHDCRYEWYSPGPLSRRLIARKDAGLSEHLERGGLDRRKVGEFVCALCGNAFSRNKSHRILRAKGNDPETGLPFPPEPCCSKCAARDNASEGKKTTGRNEPCPCGATDAAGKPVKFKNCCGRPNR